jgi:hypothetical protein
LIGPVLDLGQAITGFPDQFFDACDRLLISYELAEGPIAPQISLQLLPLVHPATSALYLFI